MAIREQFAAGEETIMIFRQLLDINSCTYTYLLSCKDTGATLLIDPVLENLERDLAILRALGLELSHTLETHVHADHITGAHRLREVTGCRVGYPVMAQPMCADFAVREGEVFRLGNLGIHALFTPGHTDHHYAYRVDDCALPLLFTGDALLIDGCGRTDFQSGDAATLYRSIHDKFFSLADETLVYPGHDYNGRFVSSIGQEKERNPRIGQNRTLEEFVEIMDNLVLPAPLKIDIAVPSNECCGRIPAYAVRRESPPPGLHA